MILARLVLLIVVVFAMYQFEVRMFSAAAGRISEATQNLEKVGR